MSRAMVMLGAGITSLFVALPWSTPKAADLNIPPRVSAACDGRPRMRSLRDACELRLEIIAR